MGMTSDDQFQAGAGGFGADPFSAFSEFWSRAAGGGAGGRQANFDEDIFQEFETFFNHGDMGERRGKGQDIFINLDIPFMDAVEGSRKEVSFEKKGTCTMCNGNKCKPGTAPSKCTGCAGKGYMNYRQGPMTIQMTCNKCRGSGVAIKSPCPQCKATGISNQQIKEEITIPKGINTGQNLRLSGKV